MTPVRFLFVLGFFVSISPLLTKAFQWILLLLKRIFYQLRQLGPDSGLFSVKVTAVTEISGSIWGI